jgi:hypothetical protein
MKIIHWFWLIAMVLFTSIASIHASPTEPPLESPYFIDAVHCSGFSAREVTESWLVAKEEVEITKKIEDQEECEDLLKSFGIEKYMWLNAEDLERISARVRQSEYFEEASLSIKKSEIKNHIHVFLKVKTKSQFVYNIGNRIKLYDGTSEYGSRFFNRLQGEVVDRAYQPNSKSTWGFTLDLALSNSALSSYPWKDNTHSTSTFFHNNYYFAELYYNYQRTITSAWTWNITTHLNSDNINPAWHSSDFLTVSLDSDLIYSKYIRFIRGIIYAGPSAIYAPASNVMGNHYSLSNFDISGSTRVFLPGAKFGYQFGRVTSTYVRLDSAWHHSLTSARQVFEGKQTIQLDLGKNVLLSLYSLEKTNNEILLVRDKAPSTDALHNEAGLGIIKAYESHEERQEISLKIGSERLEYSPVLRNSMAGFIQIGYKRISDTLNLDLAFSYLGPRIY